MNQHFAIESILQDGEVTEIMINGYQKIVVEKRGKLLDVPSPYRDNDHLMEDIYAIFAPLGLRPDESRPILDGRLPDGSRVNVVIPPIALDGPMLTIRKMPARRLTIDDLLEYGVWTRDMVEFLRLCLLGRLNIAICGGTASGKTTLANLVCGMIPDDERLVIVENENQLRIDKPRAIYLEGRPANLEGRGEITLRDLVQNATKMRPDRIIANEIRHGEAYDLIEAMNQGYDGSIMIMHANTPRDALVRLETCMSEGSPTTPLLGLREYIAMGLNLIVSSARLPSGSRRLTHITEVTGLAGDMVTLQDIFVWEQTGFHEGKETGRFRATGVIPSFIKRFHEMGIDVPLSMFAPQ